MTHRFTACAAVVLCAVATAASAQDRSGSDNAALAELRQCRTIADATARLACLDAASAKIVASVDSGELRFVDKEAVRETRRRLFGFALPDIGLFGGGKDDSEEERITTLETTITRVEQGKGGEWVFATPEGAVWQIRNAPFRFRAPKVGDKVVLKEASLGSYFIRVNDQIGVKGLRIR